jgi:TetR/AcrR family transcriptional repressor of nem operon
MKTIDARQKILEVAESLIQARGYNAFSYRDIAEIVGIKTSSIHYYFPTKVDMAKAVVKEHAENLMNILDEVGKDPKRSWEQKFDTFFELIFNTTYFADRKMCLGGMLASDVLTLPDDIQEEVRIFFKRMENWLQQLLLLGKKQQRISLIKNGREEVLMILSILEGALLLARLYHDDKRLMVALKQIKERLLKL